MGTVPDVICGGHVRLQTWDGDYIEGVRDAIAMLCYACYAMLCYVMLRYSSL